MIRLCIPFNVPVVALGVFASWSAYKLWRWWTLRDIHAKAIQLAKHGYVKIPGVSPAYKKRIWQQMLPTLVSLWKKNHPKFNIEDETTWPRPSRGYAIEDAYKQSITPFPRLYSESFMCQAVLCYLYDSSLRSVSFGTSTHFLLKMIIDPLWAVGWHTSPARITLHGDDQSWHIVNWPSAHASPVAYGGHIDAGNCSIFISQGFPPTRQTPPQKTTLLHTSLTHTMLTLNLHQTAVLLYCSTPGTLTPAHGSTGLYRYSHIILLAALRQQLTCSHSSSLPWYSNTIISSDTTSPRCMYKGIRDAVREFADTHPETMLQETVDSGDMILTLGTLMHSTVSTNQAMYGNPRVIQNGKAYMDLPENCNSELIINEIPTSSLLYQLHDDPLKLSRELFDAREHGIIAKYVDDMCHTLQS